jgi:hypothetical protein
MHMNPSTRSEVLSEPDQGKEHRGNPRVDTVLQEIFPNEQTPSRNPAGPSRERAFETFAGGAGI